MWLWLWKSNFSCNLCGKSGHKAKDFPQRNKVEYEHCGWLGQTKATCWKLEANRINMLEWLTDTVAVLLMKVRSFFEQVGLWMRMLKSFCKLYHCFVVLVQKNCCDIKLGRVSYLWFVLTPEHGGCQESSFGRVLMLVWMRTMHEWPLAIHL